MRWQAANGAPWMLLLLPFAVVQCTHQRRRVLMTAQSCHHLMPIDSRVLRQCRQANSDRSLASGGYTHSLTLRHFVSRERWQTLDVQMCFSGQCTVVRWPFCHHCWQHTAALLLHCLWLLFRWPLTTNWLQYIVHLLAICIQCSASAPSEETGTVCHCWCSSSLSLFSLGSVCVFVQMNSFSI